CRSSRFDGGIACWMITRLPLCFTVNYGFPWHVAAPDSIDLLQRGAFVPYFSRDDRDPAWREPHLRTALWADGTCSAQHFVRPAFRHYAQVSCPLCCPMAF